MVRLFVIHRYNILMSDSECTAFKLNAMRLYYTIRISDLLKAVVAIL